MKQPLKDYIKKCLDIVADCLVTFEAFNSLRTTTNRAKYTTFRMHPVFWATVNASVFNTLTLSLFKLLEKRADSVNLRKLVTLAKAEGVITPSEQAVYNTRIVAMEVIWTKVKVLRHKVIAHTCDSTSIEDAFATASVTPQELEALALDYGAFVNEIAAKGSGHNLDLNKCTDDIDIQTEQVLEKLNKA